MRQHASRRGYQLQTTTPYTSFQSGVAERAMRAVTEIATGVLVDSGLPHILWKFAIEHAAYIRNRISKRGESATPRKRVTGRRPDVGSLPIFGQAVVARVPEQVRRKAHRFKDTRRSLGAFVGCSDGFKGFRVYSAGPRRTVYTSHDVDVIDRMLFEIDESITCEITASDSLELEA